MWRVPMRAFREAPTRKHSPSCQGYHFNKDMPNRLTAETRLSVHNWNPGPRRGKEGAIERHIAGKWHIITFQEAIEYLEHDFLTNRFHVTHYGGCAVLFNKVTFFSDIKVSSIYLHETRVCEQDKKHEGESGWVLQGVVSRVSPPWKRRSSPIVANDGCATPCLRGGKVETEKHGSPVGLQSREGAPDFQLYAGSTTFGLCPTPKEIWKGCCATWLKKRWSGTWLLNLQVCVGQARMRKKQDLKYFLPPMDWCTNSPAWGEIQDSGMCDEQARKVLVRWRKECSLPTKLVGGTFRSTGAKMCRGGSSVEDWWTTCIPSSLSGVQTGHGPFRQWTESRGGRLR